MVVRRDKHSALFLLRRVLTILFTVVVFENNLFIRYVRLHDDAAIAVVIYVRDVCIAGAEDIEGKLKTESLQEKMFIILKSSVSRKQ